MSKSRDLLQRDLEVHPPSDAAGPPLWVRRVVIWPKPGEQPIRDVSLKPGLNIVWSPDGAASNGTDGDGQMGHGGGKTLFCRLLRYCLGEDRFAPKDQAAAIAEKWEDGLVGAEVILNGECWAIVRPLGTRRKHFAIQGGNLDEIAQSSEPATGIEPFLDAVEQAFFPDTFSELIPSHRHRSAAWPVALAWLTRDQECRLHGVLEWRDNPVTQSDSPVGGLSKEERVEALRAFLKAITVEEKRKRKTLATERSARTELADEIGHRDWQVRKMWERLRAALNLPDGFEHPDDLTLAAAQEAAQARFDRAVGSAGGSPATELDEAREVHEAARDALVETEKLIAGLEAVHPLRQREVAMLEGEMPGISAALAYAKSQPCPICGVPIDRALAEKCGLSHKLHDPKVCQERFETKRSDLEAAKVALQDATDQLNQAKSRRALQHQTAGRAAARLKALDDAMRTQSTAWRAALRTLDETNQLTTSYAEQTRNRARLSEADVKTSEQSRELASIRAKQAKALTGINDKFDPIVRRLVSSDARGSIKLSEGAIDLVVDKGGKRSTAAIDSLKVLAFDIAAMCLAIEKGVHAPPFLIHDSPREADLGLPLYHQLFELMVSLEETGPTPPFQYIVTTTTAPPSHLATMPYTRLTLRGAPAAERLLRVDL